MRIWIALLCTAACAGQADLAPTGDAGTSLGCMASSECPTGWTCNDFHVCEPPSSTGDAGVPPETEIELGKPISSDRFVYTAMTSEDKLARIDGTTLAVRSTPVGARPKEVATIPGGDGAVVLDTINGTATIVRPAATGADGTKVVATLKSLNRLDVDPHGNYAVIWFDLVKAVAEGTGSVGSFQDVTVVALAQGHEKAVDLTVGFQPRSVAFDAAGTRAYVITQDGVSVIDLAYATGHEPAIVPPIPVADSTVPVTDLEVAIVATGDYAAVRQAGYAGLRVVSMRAADAGHTTLVPLASPPTDIDLAPDGHRVYAVLRDAHRLAAVDIPGGGVVSVDVGAGDAGSIVVSGDGTRGLLYTNAVLDEHITLVRLDQPAFPHVTWPLKKAVRAVGISPQTGSAIVLHAKAPGDPATATSIDDFIDKSYGYSLLDLASGFAKLQLTPVDPGPFAYAPDGTRAYVALDGGDALTATRALQIVTTHTGIVQTVPLGSPPSAVGILPGVNQAFVAQRHPLGRVSFVAIVTDAVRTVTGFDLNSQVVE